MDINSQHNEEFDVHILNTQRRVMISKNNIQMETQEKMRQQMNQSVPKSRHDIFISIYLYKSNTFI